MQRPTYEVREEYNSPAQVWAWRVSADSALTNHALQGIGNFYSICFCHGQRAVSRGLWPAFLTCAMCVSHNVCRLVYGVITIDVGKGASHASLHANHHAKP